MKMSIFNRIVIMITIAFLSGACASDSEENSSNNNAAAIEALENNVELGAWIVTYFFDTDQEETSNYNGYDFTFENNGVLTATNGANTFNGTWSVTDSSSSDDSSGEDDIDFNIFFSSPPDFEELSDDWDIIQSTSSKIELIDVSGGNGGTDYLTFEKS